MDSIESLQVLTKIVEEFSFLAPGGFSESYKFYNRGLQRVLKVPSIERVSENTIDALFGRFLDTKKPNDDQKWAAVEQVLREEYKISKKVSKNPLFRKCYALHTINPPSNKTGIVLPQISQSTIGIEFEYIPGLTIPDAISQWHPRLEQRINIAKYCAEVPHYFHRKNEVMGDVKARNFIVNPFNNLAIHHATTPIEALKNTLEEEDRIDWPEFLESAYNIEPGEKIDSELVSLLHSVDWNVKAIDLGGVSTKYKPGVRGARLVMAPEQNSSCYASKETDIFGLGTIMVQILIGVVPFGLLTATYEDGVKKQGTQRVITEDDINKVQTDLHTSITNKYGTNQRINGLSELTQSMFEYDPSNRPTASDITTYLRKL